MNKFDLGIIGLGCTGKEHLSFYIYNICCLENYYPLGRPNPRLAT